MMDTINSILERVPLLVIEIGVGLGVTLLFLLILAPFLRKPKAAVKDDDGFDDPGVLGKLTPGLANVLPESEKENTEFRDLLRQAGVYKPSARDSIYALRLVLLLIPLFFGMFWGVLDPDNMARYSIIGLTIGAALFIIPRLTIYYRRKHRVAKIRAGLADTIDMFGMCASGGMNTSETLEHVADQLTEYPELTQELRILRRQAEVSSLELACADLVKRINIPEIRQFAHLLLRGAKLGQQMTSALNEQADHIRTMRKHRAMAQANRTPIWLIMPLLFCFVPAALILLLTPSFMDIYDFMNSKDSMGLSKVAESIDGVQPNMVAPGSETPTVPGGAGGNGAD